MKRKKLFLFSLFVCLGSIGSAYAGLRIEREPAGLDAGLIGYWTFDGPDITGTTALDKSGQGNDGTISGAAKAAGRIGQGLKFNGSSGDHVTANSNNGFSSGNIPWTLAAWVNPGPETMDNNSYQILSYNTTGNDAQTPTLNIETNLWLISTWGSSNDLFSNITPIVGEWTHIAGVYDGAGLRLYINGSLDAGPATVGNNVVTSTMPEIGAFSGSRYFYGKIDDARIYNRALSAAEIKRLYNMGAAGMRAASSPQANLASGLVGYWSFNGADLANDTAYDRSGQGNDGKPMGGLDWFMQASANSGTGTALAATFSNTSPSGNLIVVGVLYQDVANCTVSDNMSNTYTSAVGPTGWSGYKQEMFYAKNITGGPAITVTANFTTSVYAELYIAEYTHIDTSNPLDQVAASTGPSGGLAVSGYQTITQPNQLIVGYCTTGCCDPGSGFTARSTYNCNVFEDRMVADIGSYNAEGNASDGWVVQMATFKSDIPVSGPRRVIGKQGQGIMFDGSSGGIKKTAPAGFSTGSGAKWSLAAWAKPEAIDSQDHLITAYGNTDSGATPHISLASSDQWRVSTYNEDLDASSPLPQLGVWTHLVGTCDGADLRLYVDGTLAAGPLTVTLNDPVDNFWAAGAGVYGGDVFNGALDDVRVYNRTLSADEAKALYEQGSSKFQASQSGVLANGLAGYWPFNGPDISGINVYDRSGQGNNGTMSGGPLKVIGKSGQALNLDGQNDMATVPDHSSLDMTSAVTVSAWFYPRDLSGGWHVIAAKGISGTNSNYGLWYTGGKFTVTFGNGTWINHSTVNTYSEGQWYHLVGIIDSVNDNVRLYVNGQLDVDSQAETTNMVSNNDPLYITANYGGAWADGVIDDVRVYNRALSADEVQALYNMGR